MSDPTIQTFCCHHTGKKEDLAIRIMDEFNTDSYNAVCLASSIIGLLGALYQKRRSIHRIHYNNYPSFLSFTSEELSTFTILIESIIILDIFPDITRSQLRANLTCGRRIIVWLAVADLFASFGVLVRSSLWLKYKNIMPMPDDDVSVLFCSIISAWTQYFYTATWFWTLFYAIDTWNIIKSRDSPILLYHSIAWGIPAVTTGIGLSILYIPNATCHNLPTASSALIRILPNYCATYVPIAIVMVANPIIYTLSSKNIEMVVALPLAQFTSKERRVADALRLKFFFINVVFYICWLPNLVNGVLVWTMWFNMPVKVIITIWYIMALFNPMQALLNAMVYRKWNANKWTFSLSFSKGTTKDSMISDEHSPLLGSEPARLKLTSIPSSINNYATL